MKSDLKKHGEQWDRLPACHLGICSVTVNETHGRDARATLHPALQTPIRDRRVKRFFIAPWRCEDCGELFDRAHAVVVFRRLPNTFGLPDRLNPLATCPHCGYIQ